MSCKTLLGGHNWKAVQKSRNLKVKPKEHWLDTFKESRKNRCLYLFECKNCSKTMVYVAYLNTSDRPYALRAKKKVKWENFDSDWVRPCTILEKVDIIHLLS